MTLTATIDLLERFLSEGAGIDRKLIQTPSRDKNVVYVRYAVWYIAREWMGCPYPALGRMYGRDHSTVMYGVKKIQTDPDFHLVLDAVREKFPDLYRPARAVQKPSALIGWRL